MAEREKYHTSREGHESMMLMQEINQQIFSGGMSEEELNSVKCLMVAPGWTVGDLIEASLNFGTVKWQGDKLEFVLRGSNNQRGS